MGFAMLSFAHIVLMSLFRFFSFILRCNCVALVSYTLIGFV